MLHVTLTNVFQLICMKMCIHYWLFTYEADEKVGQLCGILIAV